MRLREDQALEDWEAERRFRVSGRGPCLSRLATDRVPARAASTPDQKEEATRSGLVTRDGWEDVREERRANKGSNQHTPRVGRSDHPDPPLPLLLLALLVDLVVLTQRPDMMERLDVGRSSAQPFETDDGDHRMKAKPRCRCDEGLVESKEEVEGLEDGGDGEEGGMK